MKTKKHLLIKYLLLVCSFFTFTFKPNFNKPIKINIGLAKAETSNYSLAAENEPLYDTQKSYYLDVFNNLDNWETYRGDNVRISVIDSGVNYMHEDFLDENKNSVISSLSRKYEYDSSKNKVLYYESLSYINDDNGHGTNVCATIASQINGIGGFGIAPNVDLVMIKTPNYYNYEIYHAIKYAADIGSDIINMSFVFYENSFTDANNVKHTGVNGISAYLQEALDYAYKKGCILVASAGNDKESSHKAYPACNDHVIAVGALAKNSNSTLASYSNYGINVDIVAPGSVYVASKESSSSYKGVSGTSFASPIIAGSLALAKSRFSNLSNDELEERLFSTAFNLNDKTKFGYGVININSLLLDSYLYYSKNNEFLDGLSNNVLIFNRDNSEMFDSSLDKNIIITSTNYYRTDKNSSSIKFDNLYFSKSFVLDVIDETIPSYSLYSLDQKYYIGCLNGKLTSGSTPMPLYIDDNNICDTELNYYLTYSSSQGFYFSNQSSDGLDIFKLNETNESGYIENVKNFIDSYLYMDLYIGETSRQIGDCINDFIQAKKAFNSLREEEQRLFLNSNDAFILKAKARYEAWQNAYNNRLAQESLAVQLQNGSGLYSLSIILILLTFIFTCLYLKKYFMKK